MSLALRQATGFLERFLKLAGWDWTVPDDNRLWRRQKQLVVDTLLSPQLCQSLPLLADSAGIKAGRVKWPISAAHIRRGRLEHVFPREGTPPMETRQPRCDRPERDLGVAKRLVGCALCRRRSGYHKRSRVEI